MLNMPVLQDAVLAKVDAGGLLSVAPMQASDQGPWSIIANCYTGAEAYHFLQEVEQLQALPVQAWVLAGKATIHRRLLPSDRGPCVGQTSCKSALRPLSTALATRMRSLNLSGRCARAQPS